jgi:hypothetical protein
MGLCGSALSPEDAAERGNDKKVDQALRDQQAQDAKVNKLLLLGATQTERTEKRRKRELVFRFALASVSYKCPVLFLLLLLLLLLCCV